MRSVQLKKLFNVKSLVTFFINRENTSSIEIGNFEAAICTVISS